MKSQEENEELCTIRNAYPGGNTTPHQIRGKNKQTKLTHSSRREKKMKWKKRRKKQQRVHHNGGPWLIGPMVYIKTYLVYIQPFLLTIFGPINYGPP